VVVEIPVEPRALLGFVRGGPCGALRVRLVRDPRAQRRLPRVVDVQLGVAERRVVAVKRRLSAQALRTPRRNHRARRPFAMEVPRHGPAGQELLVRGPPPRMDPAQAHGGDLVIVRAPRESLTAASHRSRPTGLRSRKGRTQLAHLRGCRRWRATAPTPTRRAGPDRAGPDRAGRRPGARSIVSTRLNYRSEDIYATVAVPSYTRPFLLAGRIPTRSCRPAGECT